MSRKKPAAKKIISSLPDGIYHRVGITHCPHCDEKFEHEEWCKTAIAIVTDVVHGKHGSIAVVNECPKCFEKSWVHESDSAFHAYMNWYPKEWTEVAEKVYAARHLAALRRYNDSLCATCEHLRALECKTLPITRCTYGKNENTILPGERKFYYHSCFTTQKCPAYKKRQPLPDTGA